MNTQTFYLLTEEKFQLDMTVEKQYYPELVPLQRFMNNKRITRASSQASSK